MAGKGGSGRGRRAAPRDTIGDSLLEGGDAPAAPTVEQELTPTPTPEHPRASGAAAPTTPEDFAAGGERTLIHLGPAEGAPVEESFRRFRLVVVDGPAAGKECVSSADRLSIGAHQLNDLVIDDPTVSRFHCEVRVDAEGARVLDLKSRNGTVVDGVRVREAFLRSGSLVRLGRAVVRFEYGVERNKPLVSPSTHFGPLVGTAAATRAMFAMLERAAAADVTVLLEGETGTGKGKAAEALHGASGRRDKPLITIDCSAIPANLLESELFGHEKGAFTGADARRIGAFEEADGGTIFLDEIGELPLELQPKLLRALESREIRRVGANRHQPVDVRLVAATNRDLREEVNAGRFRSDLYYRLAVVRVRVPPLRERLEDVPQLVEALLEHTRASAEALARVRSPEFIATLQRGAWPGNVRELRNYVERALVFETTEPPFDGPGGAGGGSRAGGAGALAIDTYVYAEAKKRAQDAFERAYLEHLLRGFGGKVTEAAKAAGVDRVYLYRLMRKHGIRGS